MLVNIVGKYMQGMKILQDCQFIVVNLEFTYNWNTCLLLVFEYADGRLYTILYSEAYVDCWSRAPEYLSPINSSMLNKLIESLWSWRFVGPVDSNLHLYLSWQTKVIVLEKVVNGV